MIACDVIVPAVNFETSKSFIFAFVIIASVILAVAVTKAPVVNSEDVIVLATIFPAAIVVAAISVPVMVAAAIFSAVIVSAAISVVVIVPADISEAVITLAPISLAVIVPEAI